MTAPSRSDAAFLADRPAPGPPETGLRLPAALRLARQVSARIPLGRRVLALPRGVLSLSFDDFPSTAWTVGGAVLAAHGAKATYFASGGLCGRTVMGQPQFGAADLEAAHAAGHEIGCHSWDHLSGHLRPARDHAAALERNRRFLEERLPGLRVRSFAYPYGHAPLALRWRASRSYAACRGVSGRPGPRPNGRQVDPSLLTAVPLGPVSRRDLEALVAEAAARRAWLILFTHEVEERPGAYGCTPVELDRAIRVAREAGLEIRPVGEVVAPAGGG